MDSVRAVVGRALSVARPGQGWNTQASAYSADGSAPDAIGGHGTQYVTWSGTSATVHKRLVAGVAGYGFGSELV